MSSLVVDIADAVLELVSTHGFSMTFEAVREYIPIFDLDAADPDTAYLTVLPMKEVVTNSSRSTSAYECTVNIGVQKKIDATDMKVEVDALVVFCEEVADYLNHRSLDNPRASFLSVKIDPVFSPELLNEKHVFTGVIVATYRAAR